MARDFSRSIATAIALLMATVTGSAHDRHVAGRLHVTLGWADEPAFTGSRNAVSVAITDAAGLAVADIADGVLSVEIQFGDARVTLPLHPVWGKPGELRAWLIPTRAGTYTFHVTGRVKNQPIDIRSTCSEKTFDCVSDASDLQFPAKDPSAGQLSDSVTRALPRADRALAAADTARTTALAAIGVAVLALLTAAGVGLRRTRKGI